MALKQQSRENEVDWQLNCPMISHRGAHLLRTMQWSDCKFVIGPKAQIFSAHKLILAIASPVFEAMFHGPMAEINEPIPILDVQPESFEALLVYIYSDEVRIRSYDHACDLYYGAKKYMLPHLVNACLAYLESNLNPQNACRGYELAVFFDEDELQYACINVISSETQEVLNSSSFVEANLKTVIKIFSLVTLNIENELDLFEAAERYAKINEKSLHKTFNNEASDLAVLFSETKEVQNEIISKETEDNKDVERDEDKSAGLTIRSALEQIRFLTLTPKQFSMGPGQSRLLTTSEILALFMNISDSDTDMPMPSGFSVCRESRNYEMTGAKYDESRSEATIQLTVSDFKHLKNYVLSPAYYIRNLPWRIKIDRYTRDRKEYLSFYLLCDWNSNPNGQSFVEAELRLITNKPKTKNYIKNMDYGYTKSKQSTGFYDFIERKEVLDPANGYLKDGAITLEAHVVATRIFQDI